jgi:hypothetical protein
MSADIRRYTCSTVLMGVISAVRASQQLTFTLLRCFLLWPNRYAEAESRYGPKPNVREAVAAYAQLAQRHGITPTAMALR